MYHRHPETVIMDKSMETDGTIGNDPGWFATHNHPVCSSCQFPECFDLTGQVDWPAATEALILVYP